MSLLIERITFLKWKKYICTAWRKYELEANWKGFMTRTIVTQRMSKNTQDKMKILINQNCFWMKHCTSRNEYSSIILMKFKLIALRCVYIQFPTFYWLFFEQDILSERNNTQSINSTKNDKHKDSWGHLTFWCSLIFPCYYLIVFLFPLWTCEQLLDWSPNYHTRFRMFPSNLSRPSSPIQL